MERVNLTLGTRTSACLAYSVFRYDLIKSQRRHPSSGLHSLRKVSMDFRQVCNLLNFNERLTRDSQLAPMFKSDKSVVKHASRDREDPAAFQNERCSEHRRARNGVQAESLGN